jgi:hypothetical protein
VAFDQVDDRQQPVAGLGPGSALRSDVAVVEGEERHAELVEEVERRVQLGACGVHGIQTGGQPRSVQRSDPEHVRARPGERMPQADRDPEVVLHPLAEDQPVRVVDRVGQGIPGIRAGERDPAGDLREE